MPKSALYKKPSYCITFGEDDVIFVDLTARITEENSVHGMYSLEILECPLSKEMEFSRYLASLLSTDSLENLHTTIKELLVAELTPNLFSLFYVSAIENPTA